MVIQANHPSNLYTNKAFQISKVGDEFKIEVGELQGKIIADQTIQISEDKPDLFWKLLNNLIGINPPTEKKGTRKVILEKIVKEPTTQPGRLELLGELLRLSSKEIVDKVYKEKAVRITNNLKSKAAIIKKALKILS